MGGIVWLASYPKSGNTWFRAFISSLLNDESEEISINKMKTDGIFSSRQILDCMTGVESSNLTVDEIDRLRPAVFNYLSQNAKRSLFVKVHDAYTYLDDGTPLLGTAGAKAIYIVRNPLDVAVSFANHSSKDFDHVIEWMGTPAFAFCGSRGSLPNQTRQKLLTWSMHVESWARAAELPVHIVRYEDMKADPVATFAKALRFIGFVCADEQIMRATEASSFEKLKAEEEQKGFREKPCKTASFFRSGQTGDWRNHLSEAQRDRIIADHGTMMRKYGYLDDRGNPVY
ncbi:MAG TPA: sulfotransferase domain-containing protein [Rectinemataceae bacterium]|nr:sulfotransferase domain-containing protein [Rectinemataceae bacterium]